MSGLRAWRVGALGAVLVLVMVDPGPAQAATIPTPPAACHQTFMPGHPKMTAFAITKSVDVTRQDKRIRVTITAIDDTRNVTAVSMQFQSPTIGGATRYGGVNLVRVGGTGKNGQWTGTTVIPRWTNEGTWKVTQVGLSDAGGGSAFYFPPSLGATYPWNPAWHDSFVVHSVHDITAPTLVSLKLSRGLVDTSNSSQRIDVTVQAKDSRSGVHTVEVDANPTHSMSMIGAGTGSLHLTHGTPKNGTWKGFFIVPRWVGAGTHLWALNVTVLDTATNSTQLDSAELKALNFTSAVRVRSKTDSTAPTLHDLKFSKGSVDARTGDQTVDVTVAGFDAQSALAAATVSLVSPSRAGTSSFASVVVKPGISKATFTLTIPKCSEPGTWVASVDLFDEANNDRHYSTAKLKAKGFRSTLSVKALDVESPFASAPITIDPADSIPVTFSEPTLWKTGTSQTALTFYDVDVAGPVAGTWTCANAVGTPVTCDADGANVKTATFTPTAPLTAENGYEVQVATDSIYDTSGNLLFPTTLSVTTT